MRVRHIYKDDEVIALPGADLSRTYAFLAITMATLFIMNRGDLEQIRGYQKTSVSFVLISLVVGIASAHFSYIYLNLPLNEIRNPNKILTPKFLLTFSISIFFLNIGMWIVVLGGIWSSPYAALLSVSPVLYGLQMLYVEAGHKRACIQFIETYDMEMGVDHKSSFMKSYERHKYFSYLPLLIISISLIVGYQRIDLFRDFEGGLTAVLNTDWYQITYALIYYLSVVLAIGGTMPATKTKKVTKKFFFTG